MVAVKVTALLLIISLLVPSVQNLPIEIRSTQDRATCSRRILKEGLAIAKEIMLGNIVERFDPNAANYKISFVLNVHEMKILNQQTSMDKSVKPLLNSIVENSCLTKSRFGDYTEICRNEESHSKLSLEMMLLNSSKDILKLLRYLPNNDIQKCRWMNCRFTSGVKQVLSKLINSCSITEQQCSDYENYF